MSVSIANVTKVLENDPNILTERVKVADMLEIPPAQSQPIINLYNMGIKTGYELLRDFLIIWVGRQGLDNSTIGSLSTLLLEENKFKAAADGISQLGQPTTQITSLNTDIVQRPNPSHFSWLRTWLRSFVNSTAVLPIHFGVTPPNQKFVGRSTELKEIQFNYENPSIKCLVVSGMGGQGKTELCKKFIHENPNPSPSFITWLHGDSYQQLTSSFQNLAQYLNLSINDDSEKPIQIKQLIQQISTHFKLLDSKSLWLIIIDNVDEEYPEFEEILNTLINKVNLKCFMLITSRRKNIFSGEIEQLELQTLLTTDAQQLIKNILPNSSDEVINTLCETLDNHALALQQAGAYIREKQRTGIKGRAYSIQDYLDELMKTQEKLLKHSLKLSNYNQTIHSIVQTTLYNFRNNKNANSDEFIWKEEVGIILGLIHQDGIHIKMLHEFIEFYITTNSLADEWTEENTEAVVLELAKFSLINVNNEIISIHRLVQAVLRLECDWKSNIHNLLNNADFETTSKDELFHLRSIWDHVSEYPDIVEKCPSIPNKIFWQMKELSLVLELSEFAEKNHALLAQVFGPQHEITLEMEYTVASAHYVMGEYEEALTKFYTVLGKMKLVLGEDHSYSMVASNQIALVLWKMRKLDEALEFNEKVLKSRQRVNGDNNEETMVTRNNMALVLNDLGRREEALSIHNEVLKWEEKNRGPSHPIILTTRQNRASLLNKEGQLREAKAEFESVLTMKIQIQGEEHEDTLTTKAWLADTLWKLGEKKKGLEMMQEVLVGREKVLGVNHPDTKNIRRNIYKRQTLCQMYIFVLCSFNALITFSMLSYSDSVSVSDYFYYSVLSISITIICHAFILRLVDVY